MAVFSEEQTMLRDAAKAWVAEKSPVAAFRKLRDAGNPDGFDRGVWREMAEMGWTGILIPEAYGGTGLGHLTLGIVLEETGRNLTASPLVSTALAAASAILLGGSEAQKQTWLPRIADGSVVAAFAVDEGPHHHPDVLEIRVDKRGSTALLTGKKHFVAEGGSADLIIVAAKDGLYLVEGEAKGLTRQRLHSLDSRGFANLTFEAVESEPLGDIAGPVLDRTRAGLAAEMLGMATQAFETTLDYLKTRTQFGQLIGTFQALQHRAAKMYTDLELTRSCVEAALSAVDNNANDAAQLAALAKAKAGETLHLVTNEMVQMHGGIGMTDAHDAGLYLKRARVVEALYGNAAFHRDRYATLLGY
ncbi:MAG: acyl-CoA dehydrogenase family protein [Alphaproteobacteria bacterium]|nr:acyl-CoA dehydrogenase family protein [Alphaproteobacteria bacterium]